nr:hypothetical protein [Escherichia coli]
MDKQARLALAEHVVYCRRSDKLNIPFVGSIMNLVSGRDFLYQRYTLALSNMVIMLIQSLLINGYIQENLFILLTIPNKRSQIIILMAHFRFCHHLSRTVNFLFTEDLIIICASLKFIFANRTVLY